MDRQLSRRTLLRHAVQGAGLVLVGGTILSAEEADAVRSTRYGACPQTPTTTVAQTLSKWPASRAMRVFRNDGTGPGPLPNIEVVSWSNRPPMSQKNSYVNPRFNLGAAVQTCIWTPHHEVDGKVHRGEFTLSDWRTLMTRIGSQRRQRRVKLGVQTTAWGITPTRYGGGGRDWRQYAHPAATEWGVEFDGIRADTRERGYPTHIYLRTLDVCERIRAAGYRISVSEFGAPKASWDTTGTARADWMYMMADRFRDFGMYAVTLFDNVRDGYPVYDSPGINAWRDVIRTY